MCYSQLFYIYLIYFYNHAPLEYLIVMLHQCIHLRSRLTCIDTNLYNFKLTPGRPPSWTASVAPRPRSLAGGPWPRSPAAVAGSRRRPPPPTTTTAGSPGTPDVVVCCWGCCWCCCCGWPASRRPSPSPHLSWCHGWPPCQRAT